VAGERPAKLALLESEKLIKRAMNCRRLAVGVDDSQFTLKLGALAAEYEARAMALKGAAQTACEPAPGVAGGGFLCALVNRPRRT
jgi:hypothetical protein